MALTRRHLLAAAATATQALPQARTRRPNVLVLVADDLGLHLGAYGDTQARTPRLDALAREGVRFTNAYCTTASCSASRSVMLSGLHNHANGHYGHAHAEHNFRYLPKVRPLPALLQAAGYRTGVIGKLHVNPTQPFGWDLKAEGEQRRVYEMAETAKSFVQSAGDRPWYLHVGYGDPHRAARGFANGDSYRNVTRQAFDPATIKLPSFLPDNPQTRAEVSEYYEASSRLDQGVGFMLDMLKETGQLDNTLVMFLSDNGMPFPNAKTNVYDAGLHLPLLVRTPGQTRRGVVTNAMVNWADLAPTILEWTGTKGPDYPLHGRSFLPVLEQENPTGWDRTWFSHQFHEVTMYYPMRGVRTPTHKYIRNLFPGVEFPFASDLWASGTWQSLRAAGPTAKVGLRPVESYLHRPSEELYDLTRDPDEVTNLATRPEHRQVLDGLRKEVAAWRKQTGDPWLINDGYR